MKYQFDTFPNRLSTNCLKWNTVEPSALPMWVADMDFLSPPEVTQALMERVQHGIFGYPMTSASTQESIVQWVEKRHGWKIQPEDIIFIPGIVVGFNLVARALLSKGDGLLVQPPVYTPFLQVSGHHELRQVENVLVRDALGRYLIDFDDLEEKLSQGVKMLLFCNPHNPVGRVFDRAELIRLGELCLERQVILVSDEIHNDLIFSGWKHIPIASLGPALAQQTITFMAPSKTFNLAGLSASFAIVQNPVLRKAIEKVKEGSVGFINILGLAAMEAAYRMGEPWLDELLIYLEQNRDFIASYLKENLAGAVGYTPPEGTYLAWLDFHLTGLEKPGEFLKNNSHVVVNEGGGFGSGGEQFIRLNFGCPRSLLKEGLDRIAASITTSVYS